MNSVNFKDTKGHLFRINKPLKQLIIETASGTLDNPPIFSGLSKVKLLACRLHNRGHAG